MSPPTTFDERALTIADAHAVYEVMAAQQQHEIGTVEIEEADIVSDWGRPSFDVGAQTLGVFDRDRLVGYAEVNGADRGDASVHPAYQGRGIGTRLARWMQETARARGASVIGMPVPQGAAGDRLLEELGYRVRWTSWILTLPGGASIVERELPPGYTVRAAMASEYAEVHAVIEDAFLEWSVRERESYEDFAASVPGRPGFEAWQLRVIADPSGAVVGVSNVVLVEADSDDGDGRETEAYIVRLAVRRDQRNQGLAQALMADSLARAREHGAVSCGLSTDSRTGALGLYEKVGMVVTSIWVNRAMDL